MRRLVPVLIAALALLGFVAPTSAQAVARCSGYSKYITATIDAFVGHKVQAVAKVTYPSGLGVCTISKTTTPTITFPSRLPGSAGEKVSLETKPYLIYNKPSRHSYRFTVEQSFVTKPATQTFSFDVHYYQDGRARICFTGKSCGPFSS